jgi:hypothetical protein
VTVVPVVPVVSVAIVPAVLVNVDEKHGRNNCHWNYWVNRHDCHSDYWSNRKYHRVIHSYSSINGDKYCRNNCHCNYWHHWYFPLFQWSE